MKIKLIDEKATVPTKGSKGAAGFDLYAHDERTLIPAGETKKIGTGVCVEIPEHFFGAVFARSGLATKHGLRPANCVGVIDSDYRGEIIVALHNDSENAVSITRGDRIAQLVLIPYYETELLVVDELTETDRGSNGFGSTGLNK